MITKTLDPVFDVLNTRYSEDYFRANARTLGEELNRTGIVVFDDFLSLDSIVALQKEAAALKPSAYRSASSYNVYVKPTDPSFPPDSPRNRIFTTTKGCIPDDRLPKNSVLRKIYDSAAFREFLCAMLGLPRLYPYADALSSINVNYYDKGDALEWHFDNSDFAITLLVKRCTEGGAYEYFTDMRYDASGAENYELVRKCINGEIPPKRQAVTEGSLMIFRGNKSLHRVTPVQAGERVLVTFNFNTKPGIALSEKSRQTFFGRTA